MLKFLIKLIVIGGIYTQGFAVEQLIPSQSEDLVEQVLKFKNLCTVLEESQNEQKIILDKISQRLDVDQSTLDLSEPKVVASKLNKSLEIHKLQDETYDQLKENYNLRLKILKNDNQNLKDQLQRQQMPAKNYRMMDRARDGFILLGMAGAAIGGVYIFYKFYEEGGNVFRFKVYY